MELSTSEHNDSLPENTLKLAQHNDTRPFIPLLTFVPTDWKTEDGLIKLEDSDDQKPQQRDPTQKELCEGIIMIKDKFPYCKLGRFIELLHDNTLLEEQIQKKEYAKRKAAYALLPRDDSLSDDSESEVEKRKMQMDYARKFQNSDANPRFYEERQIAKLFCSKGYGYPTAREYLGDNITPNRYNNVITTIVRLSYRKLQYFIIKNINPNLSLISREELKMIKTPLVNCRNWMTPEQADNFHRFVKLTYKINTRQPDKQMAYKIHEEIMIKLKERNINYKHHRRGEEYSGWTVDMEHQLIIHYIKSDQIRDLQREMMAQYPSYRSSFEINKLKSKLAWMVKESLRKVYADREKFGLQEIPHLNEYIANKILRSPKACDVRKRALSYYLDKDNNAKKLRWVMEVIRDYTIDSRKDVEEIEDSSCEYLPKEELKAEAKPAQENACAGSKKEDIVLDINGKQPNKKQQQ